MVDGEGISARGQTPTVRLATWNVNSIRTRIDRVADWIERHQPDVLALQETKCTETDFPHERFAELGYESAHHGLDQWNGVALIARTGLSDVRRGFSGPQRTPYDEARLLVATCGPLRVASLYVPNGRELDDPHYLFKLVWLERLRSEAANELAQHPHLALVGDFNVAPADGDIYEPKRWKRRTHASPPERSAIEALCDLGLTDVTRSHHDPPGPWTWWNYRTNAITKDQGLRIDLALTSESLTAATESVWIDREERMGERPSDHAPLVLELADVDRSV